MLSGIEKGNKLMLTRLNPVETVLIRFRNWVAVF